jgi:hypothetical protein
VCQKAVKEEIAEMTITSHSKVSDVPKQPSESSAMIDSYPYVKNLETPPQESN